MKTSKLSDIKKQIRRCFQQQQQEPPSPILIPQAAASMTTFRFPFCPHSLISLSNNNNSSSSSKQHKQ